MQAAMRSGGMFRLAKIDAEKQRSLAEVLGITAFPSVFGMKDGILLDNFVGILPQDEVLVKALGHTSNGTNLRIAVPQSFPRVQRIRLLQD